MAVEWAMLALLDATGSPRPLKRQPQDLFDALVTAAVLYDRHAQELVLATPRLRGRTAAGHAGGPIVTLGDAEAAVGSSSSSRRLPCPQTAVSNRPDGSRP